MNDQISEYSSMLRTQLNNVNRLDYNCLIHNLKRAKENNNNVFVFGNGGSGSTASHFASDMNKSGSVGKNKFKFICLNNNVPLLLSYANDESYSSIFYRQLENLLEEEDIVIGFSGSGNSANVIEAINLANSNKNITVGFTGYDGGELKNMVNISLHIPINDMQIVEDCHLALTHMIMQHFRGDI